MLAHCQNIAVVAVFVKFFVVYGNFVRAALLYFKVLAVHAQNRLVCGYSNFAVFNRATADCDCFAAYSEFGKRKNRFARNDSVAVAHACAVCADFDFASAVDLCACREHARAVRYDRFALAYARYDAVLVDYCHL